VAQQGTGETVTTQLLAFELAGGLEAHGIGFRAFVKVGVLTHTKTLGQLLIRPGTGLAVAFQFQALQVQTLCGSQALPMELVETARDEVVGGDFHGAVDHLLELGFFIPRPFAEQFMADVHALDVSKLGQHAQSGGIGGELVVGVAEVGFGFIIQRCHAVQLPLHLILDQGVNLVQPCRALFRTFPQHQIDGALDVVALLDATCGGLGADSPGGGDLEAAGPQDHAQVAPYRRILVGELHQLQAVVRHLVGQPGVDVHHGMLEILARALH